MPGKAVAYRHSKRREIDALKGFLRRKNIHYISSQKLSQIEGAFRLKDTKEVKKRTRGQ